MKVESQLVVLLILSVVGGEAKKSRRKQRETSSLPKHAQTINDVIESVCLPRRTDRLVYRFRNATHIYVGFDILEKCTVYSMTWEISKGNPDVLHRRNNTEFDLEPSSVVRKYPHDYLFATAGKRQQRMFQLAMEDCTYSIVSLSCLMEGFAKTALNMKKIRFTEKCDTKRATNRCDVMEV